MTDVLATNHKIKALELAVQANATPEDTVKRAHAYHAFLSGSAAPAAGAATGGAAGATAGATSTKTTAGATNKPKDKPADKGAAGATAGATNKPKDKPADKGAAGATAGAKTPAAGGATGAPVPPDTKAPGGKHNYADVVESLRKVRDNSSKDDAIAILVEDGGGAKSVRDLKPALYDAVVEACENVLNADGGGDAGAVEDPTAQPDRDELGL